VYKLRQKILLQEGTEGVQSAQKAAEDATHQQLQAEQQIIESVFRK